MSANILFSKGGTELKTQRQRGFPAVKTHHMQHPGRYLGSITSRSSSGHLTTNSKLQ